MDVRRSRQGQDAPSANPRRGCEPGARSAEGALRGVLSFGYFSLHKQRKVTRRKAKAFAVAFKLPNEATTSTTTAEAKLSPLRASYFSLLAQRKGNQKKARPASRPPRCALRVRVQPGDPRKGLGCFAAKSGAVASRRQPARRGEAVLRLFPASPALPRTAYIHVRRPSGVSPPWLPRRGDPVDQKPEQQPKPSKSKSKSNGNGNGFDAARLA